MVPFNSTNSKVRIFFFETKFGTGQIFGGPSDISRKKNEVKRNQIPCSAVDANLNWAGNFFVTAVKSVLWQEVGEGCSVPAQQSSVLDQWNGFLVCVSKACPWDLAKQICGHTTFSFFFQSRKIDLEKTHTLPSEVQFVPEEVKKIEAIVPMT
ncbi:hypothetical protein HAX54_015415 [Datura stramonium]|uniref:Uncharacterized protein n=1 Tax=Datura stramonium TaxID=4076 RepID=A0ABS8TS54_DATST|nr:hypothetical protein [Datura stramonium]